MWPKTLVLSAAVGFALLAGTGCEPEKPKAAGEAGGASPQDSNVDKTPPPRPGPPPAGGGGGPNAPPKRGGGGGAPAG